jgi:hypothetical protein
MKTLEEIKADFIKDIDKAAERKVRGIDDMKVFTEQIKEIAGDALASMKLLQEQNTPS